MEIIRGIGKKNIIDDFKDGEGTRIARDFLDRLLTEFAKQSSKYMIGACEAPFAYKEKQLHSMLAPSISKITPLFLMEQPIEREWSKLRNANMINTMGWLDYWCRYRNIDFFIELKHGIDSFSTDNIRKNTKKDWLYANSKQLQFLKKEAKLFSQWSKGVILLSLHVISIYETTKLDKQPKSSENIEDLLWIQQNYYTNLKPKPNWSGLWILNNTLVETCKVEYDKSDKYYPGVLWLSRISEIIK